MSEINELFLPFYNQVINISSIVGSRHLDFLLFGPIRRVFTVKENPIGLYPASWGWGPPLFIFLQILQTVVPIIPEL